MRPDESGLECVRRSQASAGVAPSLPVPMPGSDERTDPDFPTPSRCSLVKVEAGSSGGLVREHPPAGTHRVHPVSAGLLVYTEKHEPTHPPQTVEEDPISPKWRLQRTAKAILPHAQGLQKCHKTPRGQLEVWRSAERSTAAYRGLCSCNSVWCCPVCSAKIAARRAQELTQAIDAHRATGGTVYLLTFTASHTREDQLGQLVKSHMSAHAHFWRHGPVRRTIDAMQSLGRVSAFEVTFGHESGWHPHRHVLLFVKDQDPFVPVYLAEKLPAYWSSSCEKYGLHASAEHGLDIRGGEAAGAYVAKLGLEVALAVRKLGRGSRFGIWQLLEHSQHAWARSAFHTFATTMKGKRHLVWSRGLKALFQLEDITDEEIMADGGSEDETLLAILTRSLWRGVYANEIRGELLRLLGVGDVEEARTLLRAFGLDDSGLQTAS